MANEQRAESEQPASSDLGDAQVPPSLTDQVLAELFSKLNANVNITPVHLKALRQLATAGELLKAPNVRAALEMEHDAHP